MPRRRARSTLFRAAKGSGAFNPVDLFTTYNASGFYYDLTVASGLFQDDGATTPVTADGQSIGYAADLSSGGNHGTQTTAAAKPTWKTGSPNYANFDGGDALSLTLAQAIPFYCVAVIQQVGGGWRSLLQRSGSNLNLYAGKASDDYKPAIYTTGWALVAGEVVNDALHVVTYRFDGTGIGDISVQVDNNAPVYNTVAFPGALANWTGITDAASQQFTGQIASLFLINALGTDTEVAQVKNYLAAQAGISL